MTLCSVCEPLPQTTRLQRSDVSSDAAKTAEDSKKAVKSSVLLNRAAPGTTSRPFL